MAIFDLSNAAGRGFNMSGTDSSGWAYVEANSNVTTQLIYDDGSVAIFNMYGSTLADRAGVSYSVYGDQWTIYDLVYAKNGQTILTVSDLYLHTTTSDLQAGGWLIRMNAMNDEFYGNDFNDIIRAGYGDDLVVGFAGNDTLFGDQGADQLWGGLGNDRLDGGAGADRMAGGSGSDTYVVDNAGDIVDESGSDGIDTVLSAISFSLADTAHVLGAVEKLTLLGTASINATGNALDNILTGNAGNNVLDGGTGVDVMAGGAGSDVYVVDNAGDIVNESVVGSNGIDTVRSEISFSLADATHVLGAVENLTLLGTADINATGNALNNMLTGNAGSNILDGGVGADRLDGGAGADVMLGGSGDDFYVVDNAGDIIDESLTGSNGIDTVQSAISFSLDDTAHVLGAVENLTLLGSADINATGNTLNNVLTGNAGSNILDGGAGADRMAGGAGDDVYVVDNAGDIVNESVIGSNGIDTVQSAISFSLADTAHVLGAVENLTLLGSANINATGNALNNVLTGNAGNNVLNGGAGADVMAGGAGNDTYVVDNAGDIVDEGGSDGTDTVQSAISFSLADVTHVLGAVENLTLLGTTNINATGNELDNVLTGNAGSNVLNGGAGADRMNGGAGADRMAGGAGNDTYVVDNAGDIIDESLTGSNGTDTVQSAISFSLADAAHVLGAVENLTLLGIANINATGNELDNVLTGNAGSNVLNGGAGADVMAGGAGNDTYVVDNASDIIDESLTGSNGTDTVRSEISFSLADAAHVLGAVENLTLLGATDINATGNALNNTLTGNAGNNVLDGGAGADRMAGGAGNDTYVVDNAGDIIDENLTGSNGTDTVRSEISFSLADAAHVLGAVENLTLLGTASINATGNALNNVLIGNAGVNVLNGGAGADRMAGGAGNDTYLVDNAGDIVDESGSDGTDTVQSAISFSLADAVHVLGAVENLTLLGTANINATGNELNNVLTGNAGSNVLNGGGGSDSLTGGGGADIFVFDRTLSLANVSTIMDFDVATDTIRLSKVVFATLGEAPTLTEAAFHIGETAHDANDRIIYNPTTGALSYDADGDGAGAALQFATLGTGLALTNADFFVV